MYTYWIELSLIDQPIILYFSKLIKKLKKLCQPISIFFRHCQWYYHKKKLKRCNTQKHLASFIVSKIHGILFTSMSFQCHEIVNISKNQSYAKYFSSILSISSGILSKKKNKSSKKWITPPPKHTHTHTHKHTHTHTHTPYHTHPHIKSQIKPYSPSPLRNLDWAF